MIRQGFIKAAQAANKGSSLARAATQVPLARTPAMGK